MLMDKRKGLLVRGKNCDLPSYTAMLKTMGYDTVTSGSFEEGARLLETEDFDFAIVHQCHPAFEGRRVLEQANKLHRRIPVVVVARSLSINNYLEAMDLGAADYLERPKLEEVEWVLETHLRRSGAIVMRDEQSAAVA